MNDQQILNQDFDLNTFYWMYAKSDSSGAETVVTYTVACYDTSKGHLKNDGKDDTPYLIVETKPLQGTTFWSEPEQDEYTVDGRVLEAVKKHFSHQFMVRDGLILMAEYCNGAGGVLHKHPEFGQAIFGMDLEEAYCDA